MEPAFAPDTWVEYVGDHADDPTPTGARGLAYYFAPNEGGYLVRLEGGGSGFYPEEDLRAIDEPEHDPRRSVFVSVERVNEQLSWVARLNGFDGEAMGSFPTLDAALAGARPIARSNGRELVWLSPDGRRVDGREPPTKLSGRP